MDIGSFFILLIVLVLVVGGAIFLVVNAGFVGGKRGSRPPVDPKARPRHTVVDLQQNLQDEPHGEPLDRRP
jgi:hypothetical protein